MKQENYRHTPDHLQQLSSRSLSTFTIVTAGLQLKCEWGEQNFRVCDLNTQTWQRVHRSCPRSSLGKLSQKGSQCFTLQMSLRRGYTNCQDYGKEPLCDAFAWIKVTGNVLSLPSTIMVAVINRQAVREVLPRCAANADNQQVCVWSAVAANVGSWNDS